MGVWKKQKTFRITRDLMRLLQKEHLLIFQSTLPDPRSRAPVTAIARFQSTLPERGETLLPFSPARRREVFQSTLPAWGETNADCIGVIMLVFQSTLPAWGETLPPDVKRCELAISIHSPRMGRDDLHSGHIPRMVISIHSPRMGRDCLGRCVAAATTISIHSPRMGRDRQHRSGIAGDPDFNPLSPHGERRAGLHLCPHRSGHFNPLSPHGERRVTDDMLLAATFISIHSPRMGRDMPDGPDDADDPISIHSPRMGRDQRVCANYHRQPYFNPLSPHGERQPRPGHNFNPVIFQSTLPAWGETASGRVDPCGTR